MEDRIIKYKNDGTGVPGKYLVSSSLIGFAVSARPQQQQQQQQQ